MASIKQVSDKSIELSKAYPGSDVEEQNLLPKIVAAYGKAKSAVAGLGSWLQPEMSKDTAILIEKSRKGSKSSSKDRVFFNLVFDKGGLRMEAQVGGAAYSCSNLVDIPAKPSDQRDLLKDMHSYSSELVGDDELAAFNKANPTEALKALYAERDSPRYKYTNIAKMIDAKDNALRQFKDWLEKPGQTDLDYLVKNPKARPPAVVKRVEDKLKAYNQEQVEDIKKRIKKAEDAL